ncbi:ATP-binding protein [Actinomadura fibrosa]|uniref:ATP-binding protein n=1 Tax=Actinomadura fibrosa TaxID=111802 RepID=A0ABW2XIR9_9ACTN|nr:ATP-binding protein [Actinomadura fibrosa]
MSGEHHTIELPSDTERHVDVPPPAGAGPDHNGNGTVTAVAPSAVSTTGRAAMLLGELDLPATRESVPRARAFSRSVATASGIGHIRDDAEVLVSELVTNAVQHATSPGSTLRLRLLRAGTRLRVEVHDTNPAVPTARQVDLMEETGRGWFLVAVIAERHGTDHTSSGKSVWCEVRAWPRDERPAH